MTTESPKMLKFLAIGELVMAAGFVLFWTGFFLFDLGHLADPRLREIYRAFEHAFPVADSWIVFCLVTGGVGLLKNKKYGTLFTLLAGSSLVFLGLLDVSFNIQQGMYRIGIGEAVMNASINLICFAAGILFVTVTWKRANCK